MYFSVKDDKTNVESVYYKTPCGETVKMCEVLYLNGKDDKKSLVFDFSCLPLPYVGIGTIREIAKMYG